jgi:hypothetical protein
VKSRLGRLIHRGCAGASTEARTRRVAFCRPLELVRTRSYIVHCRPLSLEVTWVGCWIHYTGAADPGLQSRRKIGPDTIGTSKMVLISPRIFRLTIKIAIVAGLISVILYGSLMYGNSVRRRWAIEAVERTVKEHAANRACVNGISSGPKKIRHIRNADGFPQICECDALGCCLCY